MPEKALFGQYWPESSEIHRMDPRAKLLLTFACMIIIFSAHTAFGLIICALFMGGLYLFAHIPLLQAIRSIGPLLFIVVITAILNIFFVQGGTLYFQWWIISVSEAGLLSAAFLACRLLLLLFVASLLTLTTTTLDITDAFEYLLSPLRRFKLPAHEVAMIMSVALRFLPQLAFELKTIYRAQISRGATFSGNPFKAGMQAITSLVVPLFTSSFRHAETLSDAMDSRCYHGGVGRTRLHPLAYTMRDGIGVAVVVAMFVLIIVINTLAY